MQDSKLYLRDIIESIDKIEDYTEQIHSPSDLKSNSLIADAVVRNLAIIGEAVKNLPHDLKKKRSGTDWRKIVGLRDILVHAYFGVDYDIIWDIVTNKLPELREAVAGLISELE
jgi:uncharacterized protein with HEPN domain